MASTISAGTTAGTAIAITGDTSGNLALLTQNGANTITVPNGTGTIAVNGVSSNIVAGTAVASTSGTSIDYTSIPSWVKRITILFNQVSTNGTSPLIIQIGSGSPLTSGYVGAGAGAGNGGVVGISATSSGFLVGNDSSASYIRTGQLVLTNITGNTWTMSGLFGVTGILVIQWGAGSASLSGTLDRVRITTTNGTDTFDAGTINILYE